MQIKRRDFIQSAVAVTTVLRGNQEKGNRDEQRSKFSLDQNKVKIYSPDFKTPVKVLLVSDTHLWMDDQRGEPYTQYSGRMAKAYNVTRHFQTGEPTNPNESFEKMIRLAKDSKVDLLSLPGDLFSFPSEAAIDWVTRQLGESGVPFQYAAGNHDWHYEGMEGTLASLRNQWTTQRLGPLYQGDHPLMTVREIHGIRIVMLDNSIYEILPEQLTFFREQVKTGKPLVLFVHIPLYAPGRPVSFGCGHPQWGWDIDKSFTLERRPRWPKAGHTSTTMDFHKEVFAASNLLGVFAGHTHKQSLDVINGIPQFVTAANAMGAFMEIDFLTVE
ncbi:3',5'-cyclic adenosine monophosphate phosphodiesterase CpdA [Dyadobacter sp. CECT 9275]|uniref:3',5'-cyclic adenosine monophosphate phosphodiesterase CpdA n=1 Tax=Dyadobacter helix TaxID=2822344 RepID=A0A916NBL2_9BACT|nr:metallophosphoesterase [Dyadobacter sp. CECT 9275]CAG4995136.1 3',5'-cyclic adenosine monophosphate phosphodiesterase CpdA [Dyadobacter sp. CECT 9275]